jgi:hypothetical protein
LFENKWKMGGGRGGFGDGGQGGDGDGGQGKVAKEQIGINNNVVRKKWEGGHGGQGGDDGGGQGEVAKEQMAKEK